MSGNTQHRLSAIVSAVVVGYSRLRGAEEAGTRAAFRAHRSELIAPLITAHDGRIVKTMGYGLLLEFPSVVTAVECAIEIQKGIVGHNAGVVGETAIRLRIGVHLGDVVVEGDDIFGDGVNIAELLQEFGEANSVTISDTAHENIVGRIDAEFFDVGDQELKDLARPVRFWQLSINDTPIDAVPEDMPLPLPNKPSNAMAVAPESDTTEMARAQGKSPPELRVQEQLSILQKGVGAWNSWKQTENGGGAENSWVPAVDLRGVDLTGLDLSGYDFGQGWFAYPSGEGWMENSDLRDVDFTGACLDNAILEHANLRGATLVKASLKQTNFSYASLNGVNFSAADLTSADLRYADLTGATMQNANLQQANLLDANLTEVDLSINGTRFAIQQTVLKRGNIRGADLCAADLRGVDLREADLRGADLRGAILGQISIPRDWGDDGFAHGEETFWTDLDGANLHGVRNLTCDQLTRARNWEKCFRDLDLECGRAIPERNEPKIEDGEILKAVAATIKLFEELQNAAKQTRAEIDRHGMGGNFPPEILDDIEEAVDQSLVELNKSEVQSTALRVILKKLREISKIFLNSLIIGAGTATGAVIIAKLLPEAIEALDGLIEFLF